MSPSWNFPTRAEPSYEGSEPSRAKLGHFNFQAETELTICASLSSKFFRFSNFASVTWFESISWWSIIHLNFCSIKVHNFVIFQCFSEQVYHKKKSWLVFAQFSIPSWSGKGHEPNRAEKPSARAMARASFARTHH